MADGMTFTTFRKTRYANERRLLLARPLRVMTSYNLRWKSPDRRHRLSLSRSSKSRLSLLFLRILFSCS